MRTVQDEAVNYGIKLARKLFMKRGNHSEAHLSETELAALLAIAYARIPVRRTDTP